MKRTVLTTVYVFLSCFFHAQTDSLNYVYTKSCLDADCIKKTEVVQYYDGLGRPFQTIDIKGTPLKKDMVSHVAYDQYGRPSKTYLPVPQQETRNGLVYENPLLQASAVYGTEKIFGEQIIENSPLERVKQSIGSGTAWADKPVNYTYSTNTAATEVKKYTVTTDWVENPTDDAPASSGYYAVNSLMKTAVTDEDGNTVTEYKNGKGQTVLVRKNDGSNDINTYYIYDQYSRLVYVIPPLASAIQNLSPTDLARLCYRYRYDGLGRLVEKKLPGKGWEYMVYNKADQLVMSQDASLKSQGKWLVTRYDQFGRVILTGITSNSSTRQSLQDAVTSAVYMYELRSSVSFTVSGMPVYYTNRTLPAALEQVLSINYYDTYPSYDFNPSPPTGSAVLTGSALADGKSTQGMPVLSLVKNIENDSWTKDYTWYDTEGRAVVSHSINHLGGYTRTEGELDFTGITKRLVTRHKRLNTDTERVITETFEYDDHNRLTVHKHQVGNNAEEVLSRNSYNELSQVTNKKVGGTAGSVPLESIDYSYNIRGWLTKINNPKNLAGKLFGYEIKYNRVEGLETPNPGFADLKVKPRYNGNIAEIDWKTNTASGDYLRRYGYVYDKLNRISAGFYQKDSNPSAQEYFEITDYDMNGNIRHLQRSSALEQNFPVASKIDHLTYTYTGNRLSSVADASTDYRGYPDVSGNPISYYEESGNMKDHIDKGILEIKYNTMDLPDYVRFDKTYVPRVSLGGNYNVNVNVQYLYRADGTKLKKTYTYGSLTDNKETATATEYLDGFQYEAVSATGKFTQGLKFVPTAEGYYDFEKNKYIYSYTDHLGNIRLSYFKNASGSAEVLEENNYYPFGLKHEGYNPAPGNPAYRYQYGGKEFQKETGWSDFGARMYMPDLGRWGAMDPLAEVARAWTPYRYAFDNPLKFTDPDGRIEISDMDKMLQTGGSYNYSGGKLNYLGGGNLGSLVDDRLNDSYYTLPVSPDDRLGSYFLGIDFSKFGAENNDCPKCPKPTRLGEEIGTQVLKPQTGFWEKISGTRTWTDSKGNDFLVDSEGKIIMRAPLTGDVPIGPASNLKGLKSLFTFTKSAGKHITEFIKSGENAGRLARPYMRSSLTIQEIIATGKGIPDATAKGALNFRVPGTFRGSSGTWELVVDTNKNLIYHFNFVK